jgi:hypothetical protein
MSSRGRRCVAAVVACAALVLSSCAEIPTSGPIRQGEQVQASFDDPVIRVLPRPPEQGLSPEGVVSGFLAASASFEDDHGVARQFMTAEASDQWRPDAGVVVYDDRPGLDIRRRARAVTVTARENAHINVDGSLAPRSGEIVDLPFTVERVGDEWRISSAPNGLVLTRFDVARTYRSYALHFVAPHQERLVPDPVFIPIGRTGAATTLVRSLLDGPTRWLAPAVSTAVPTGTELVVDSVPVENGVALVDLTGTVLDAGDVDRERLAAQLVWTLTELPDVTGVTITVDGSLLPLPDAPAVQNEETWAAYNPNGLPTSAAALLVRQGVVRRVQDDGSTPVEGTLGSGAVRARHPATSADGSVVAALLDNGSTAVVEEPFLSKALETVLEGNNLAPPSMDAVGSLWLVDREDGGSRVWRRTPDGRLRAVQVPELRNRVVSGLRVSLDGTRVAVVVLDREGLGSLLMGRVVQGGGRVEIQALQRLEDDLSEVRDVTWMTADSLAVLGRERGSVLQPFEIGIDGTIDELGGTTLRRIRTITAAPGFPLLASTSGAGIWESSALGWRAFLPGRDPAYPG